MGLCCDTDKGSFYPEKLGNFQVPVLLRPYIRSLYTDEELALADWLGGEEKNREEIERTAGRDCGALLDLAYRKATINVTATKPVRYKMNPIKMRVGNMATFHRFEWEALPAEGRKILSEWHFKQFLDMKKSQDFDTVSAKKNKVLPLEETIRYMREIASEVYVIPCDCKSTAGKCDKGELEICLEFSSAPNTPVGRGYGRKLSLAEAEEIIRLADKRGLYHTVESHGICNCCRCCCYPGRASLELGYGGRWPETFYVVSRDDSLCVNCGTCVRRCPKSAMCKGTDPVNRPTLRSELCWGCGLCVNTCEAGALFLLKRH